MKPVKCKICGKQEWEHVCTGGSVDTEVLDSGKPASGSEELAVEPDPVAEPEKAALGGEGCVECGATTETFADAEKWRKLKARQRAYMRKKRGGK